MAARVLADCFGFMDVHAALDSRKNETTDMLLIERLASLESKGFGSIRRPASAEANSTGRSPRRSHRAGSLPPRRRRFLPRIGRIRPRIARFRPRRSRFRGRRCRVHGSSSRRLWEPSVPRSWVPSGLFREGPEQASVGRMAAVVLYRWALVAPAPGAPSPIPRPTPPAPPFPQPRLLHPQPRKRLRRRRPLRFSCWRNVISADSKPSTMAIATFPGLRD